MAIVLPNDIENETPADATEVEQNYNVIEAYINTSVITRNGAVAMQAPLHLFGDPIGDDDAVRKAYVDAILPIGVILPYGGITVPAGAWAFCNGAEVETALYPRLFEVIQYRFGGTGGTFKLPDLRGRIPIGLQGSVQRFNQTGKTGGDWEIPVPRHLHVMNHFHPPTTSTGQANHTHTHAFPHQHSLSVQTGVQSGDHRHGVEAGEGTTFATFSSGAGTGSVGAGGGSIRVTSDQTSIQSTDHSHHVTGPTGGVAGDEDRTGPEGISHTHEFDVPQFVGDTNNTGVANAEHLPPYLVVAYLVRVG